MKTRQGIRRWWRHVLGVPATGRAVLVVLHPTGDPPITTLYLVTRTAARDQPHVAHARSALLLVGRSW